MPFTEECLPSGPSTINTWLVECWRDSCPSGSFSHLHRGTLELCQSDHWVLGHLPDHGTSPPIAQFGQGRVLVVPNFFHLRMMKAAVFLGTFNAAESFWYLDTTLSRSSTDNSFNLMAWFLLWNALSTVVPYIDRCVPFQIMSNQLNVPQVDSNQVVETSQGWSMETGFTQAQFRVS